VSIVWIIILCVIIVLLAGFLGWAIYKWKQAAKETDDKRYVVYSTEDKAEPLASQTNNFQSETEV
jgi:flagellar basal body-associated protein FliL